MSAGTRGAAGGALDPVLRHWGRCHVCRHDLREGAPQMECPVYRRIVEREREATDAAV